MTTNPKITDAAVEAAFNAWCDVAEVDEWRVRNSLEALLAALEAALPHMQQAGVVAWIDSKHLEEQRACASRAGYAMPLVASTGRRGDGCVPLYTIPAQPEAGVNCQSFAIGQRVVWTNRFGTSFEGVVRGCTEPAPLLYDIALDDGTTCDAEPWTLAAAGRGG